MTAVAYIHQPLQTRRQEHTPRPGLAILFLPYPLLPSLPVPLPPSPSDHPPQGGDKEKLQPTVFLDDFCFVKMKANEQENRCPSNWFGNGEVV